MSVRPIQLGPFELRGMLGRGGMAEVWRGVHVREGVPVAIKVITSKRAREPQFILAFQNEVQQVARLHHPGIVLVLDHGEVTPAAAAASEGRLIAGSPYLAMELASWGSLDRVKLPIRWGDLVRLLLALLDALAHAHARGVIHRDLKPGNVLLASEEDARPGLKLTDFGIAHALEQESRPGTSEASSGTPHFMSPEQFRGAWRDYGPWTDLYAVGCVAYVLATGRHPFEGDALQLAWAHMNAAPPRIAESLGLPEAFEGWIRRLMAKDPRDRFQRAADAGWALMTLTEQHRRATGERTTVPDDPTEPSPEALRAIALPMKSLDAALRPERPEVAEHATELAGEDEAAPTIAADARGTSPTEAPTSAATVADVASAADLEPPTQALSPTLATGSKIFAATLHRHTRSPGTLPWVGDDAAKLGALASARGLTPAPLAPASPLGLESKLDTEPSNAIAPYPRRTPPLPRSWRRSASWGTSMRLVGAGLRLYGLRTVPLVDRDEERDAIWEALRRVRESRSARAMVLGGAAGNGKSRLVEWMSQRAEEVGGAIVLKATHGPRPSVLDGLPRMIQRHVRAGDLSREDTRQRLESVLRAEGVTDANEWNALTELVLPSGSTGADATTHLIRFGSATERHTLVRRFVERIAAERPVIVWLEDVQWGSDATAFALHVLQAQATSPAPILLLLTVRDEALLERPLERKLVGELLAHPLTSKITVGPLSPGDHAKLVSELLLLEGDLAKDVALRTGGNPLFAVQLVGDWVERGVLEVGRSGFVLQPGERAVLPDDIHQVWSTRIARALVGRPPAARIALELAAVLGRDVDAGEWSELAPGASEWIEPLLESRLAVKVDGGWTFAHGMLRESLERSASEAGRLVDHHRAAARMLARRYGESAPGIAARIGVHHLGAGDLDRAIGPLYKGALERFDASDYPAAHALLDERERALGRSGAGEDDLRFGEGWILQAKIAVQGGRFEEAATHAARAEIQARRWGWKELLPAALAEGANVAYERGDQARATSLYEKAMELYAWIGDRAGIARCHSGLGDAAYRKGEHLRAEARYQEALALYAEIGDAPGQASALWGIGYVALWKGELDVALSCFERQLALVEGRGNRYLVARSVNALGEVARQRGELQAAEVHYRRALELDEAIGSASAWVDRMNLSLVLLARQQYGEARRIIETVLAAFGDGGEPGQLAVVHSELLPSLAHARDWDAWDRHFAKTERLLAETGLKEGDVAWVLEIAGRLAGDAGQIERSLHAFALAREQWMGLGRTEKVGALDAEVGRMALRR